MPVEEGATASSRWWRKEATAGVPGLTAAVLLALASLTSTVMAEEAPAADTSDWDWGSFEAMDETPVTQKPVRKGAGGKEGEQKPRRAAEAEADLDAEPHPVQSMFDGMVTTRVIPSARDADMHPCGDCHEWAQSNPEPRKLQEPHDNFQLSHGLEGKQQIWCFTCHDLKGKGGLRTLEGERLEFSESYVLCSQCHAAEARDWAFGAHGKRVSGWREERTIYTCTACHYQHAPELDPRRPLPPPTLRAGLERTPAAHTPGDGHKPLWERLAREAPRSDERQP